MFDRIVQAINKKNSAEKEKAASQQQPIVDLESQLLKCEQEARSLDIAVILVPKEQNHESKLTNESALKKLKELFDTLTKEIASQNDIYTDFLPKIQVDVYDYCCQRGINIPYDTSSVQETWETKIAGCAREGIQEELKQASSNKDKEWLNALTTIIMKFTEIKLRLAKLKKVKEQIGDTMKSIKQAGRPPTPTHDKKLLTLDGLKAKATLDKEAKKAYDLLMSPQSELKKAINETTLDNAFKIYHAYQTQMSSDEKSIASAEKKKQQEAYRNVLSAITNINNMLQSWLEPLLTTTGIAEAVNKEGAYNKANRKEKKEAIKKMLKIIENDLELIAVPEQKSNQRSFLDAFFKPKQKPTPPPSPSSVATKKAPSDSVIQVQVGSSSTSLSRLFQSEVSGSGSLNGKLVPIAEGPESHAEIKADDTRVTP